MKAKDTASESRGLFQRIALFSFEHIKISLFAWLAIVILGIGTYGWFLAREGFPNIQIPVGIVQIGYPNNAAAQVDSQVVQPVDAAIRKLSEVKSTAAASQDNFGQVIVSFDDSVDSSAQGLEKIKTIVKDVAVPAGASVQYLEINAAKFNNRYEAILAVTSPTTDDPLVLAQLAAQVAEKANRGELALGDGYSAEVIDQFVSGAQPDGSSMQFQRSADRIGRQTYDGLVFKNTASIGILSAGKADTFDLQKRLDAFVSAAQTADTQLVISASYEPSIAEQISGLQTSLLEGLLIVLIISFLLIHFRAGIVTGLSMVTVLLLTIIILWIAGITLNTITLFSLIICLGLIVDDTTIVAEAIDSASKRHAKKRKVIQNAVGRVALASTAGTLTTMLGFAPLLFIGGVLGSFIRILPITIITSLAVSLLVSITLVPFLSRWSIHQKPDFSPLSRLLQFLVARPLARVIRITRQGRLAKVALSLLAISLSVATAMVTVYYGQKLTFDIFPSSKDSNGIMITVRLKGATSITDAVDRLVPVEQTLRQVAGNQIKEVAYYNQIDRDNATMFVTLTSYKQREVTSPEIVTKLQTALNELPSTSVSVRQMDAGPPKDDLPFRVQISTEDPAVAQAAIDQLIPYLNATTLTRTNGTTAQIINAQATDGSSIRRVDGKRIAEVRAGFTGTDTSTLVGLAKDAVTQTETNGPLAALGLKPEDIRFDFGSEQENQDSFKSMVVALPVLLVVMFVLLAIQFRSILQPLLIFLAVPFSLVGVTAGLYATNNPLSFFVMIGLFALIGISVNNTILLTDYANQGVRSGLTYIDAIAEALEQRFRPLLVTSLTAIVALIPLAISDPFWEPLCVTLIFGLLASTFMVITVFPYYYLMMERLRNVRRRRNF